MTPPSQLILAVARQRDREAFVQLFHLYAPRIKGLLLKRGASQSQADEVVQEVMLTIWRQAERFDPERASANAWVFGIARNKHVDRLRRQSRPAVAVTQPRTTAPPDIQLSERRAQRLVVKALDKLPFTQAQVLRESFFGFKTQAEIAQSLDLPIGTIKSRTRLGLKQLRAMVDET